MTNCSSSLKDRSKDAVVRTKSSAGGQAKLTFGVLPTLYFELRYQTCAKCTLSSLC